MTVTQMARMGGSALESWYTRHPEEIGMKTGDLPPAGYVNPYAAPGMDITGHDPNDWHPIEVSDDVKKEIKDLIFKNMKENYGMSGERGRGVNDIIKEYDRRVPVKDLYNSMRTLTQIHHNEAVRIQNFVRSRIPGWEVGQAFDTSILDEYRQGIDIKA